MIKTKIATSVGSTLEQVDPDLINHYYPILFNERSAYLEGKYGFYKELPKSFERKTAISNILYKLRQYCKRVGVDVSDIAPKIRNVHYLSEEEFDRYNNESGRDRRACSFTGTLDVVITEQDDLEELYTDTLHELIHNISFTKFFLEPCGNKYEVCSHVSGFSKDRDYFKFFNEGFTEFMTINLKQSWKKSSYLKDYCKKDIADDITSRYMYNNAFVRDLIKDVSDKTEEDFDSIIDLFFRSYLTGDGETFKLIKELYGDEALGLISNLSPKNIIRTSKELGLMKLHAVLRKCEKANPDYFN